LTIVIRVTAGLFTVYVQLMNISITDMHISLLFYCHNKHLKVLAIILHTII